MADDNTNPKQEEVVEDDAKILPEASEENQETETQVEETSEEPKEQPEQETQEEETTETEEAPVEEEGEEQAPPSRREQLRIQTLLKKYGPPPERTSQPKPNVLDYKQTLDADPEVIEQLEADRQRAGQVQYAQGQSEGLRRAEYLDWKTSLKIDAPNVEKKYPILDPKAPEFHPAVADAINTWYLKMSGYDSETETVASNGISYADFVESNMELVEEIAGQKNAQTVKNVAKQAAATGLRPDGSSAKRLNLNQAPENMTIEELYASIGQKPPTKS